MTTPVKPLPCIVCGYQPDSIDKRGGYQHVPYAATAFSAGAGHYGSTVWDEMSHYRTLEIVVCDKCLVKNKERVAVDVTGPPVRAETVYLPWEVSDEVAEMINNNPEA